MTREVHLCLSGGSRLSDPAIAPHGVSVLKYLSNSYSLTSLVHEDKDIGGGGQFQTLDFLNLHIYVIALII